MVEAGGASVWAAPKVQRARQSTVLLMEVASGVGIWAAVRQHVENLACASGMVGGRGAKWKVVLVVLRVRQDCASLMVEDAGASIQDAPRGPREVPCFARLMVFWKAHGRGKRCVFDGCTRGVEGSTPFCKGHSGGKRFLFDVGGICPKSVHGGTNFCVAHGGGKRCAVPGCTKSTDFCKGHGGGKRCMRAQGACEKFAREKSKRCAAHASMVHESEKGKTGGMLGPGQLSFIFQ